MKILLKILRRLKVLPYINLRTSLTLNGTTFRIPVIQGLGLSHLNVSEIWMIELLKILNEVKSGAFIDIGVNIGQTLLKAKSVNPNLHYIGFEPNANCVSYVEELIHSNGFSQTSIIPAGIANRAEVLELHFYQKTSADSSASLDENLRPSKKIHHKKAVQVVDFKTIEKIIPEQIGIVKIDVEGFELYVLQGIQQLVIEKRPIILLEILPVTDEKKTARLERQHMMETYFRENNYRIARLKKDESERLKELEFIHEIGNHSSQSDSDYVVVPAELELSLRQAAAPKGYMQKNDDVLV